MSDWKERSNKNLDVVFFSYTDEEHEKTTQEVYIWDLDKTYLDTKYETLMGIIKTALERGVQKRNVPGTGALVRALKSSWLEKHRDDHLAIYFITASPPQLEEKIIEKLEFDGFKPYGIYCKDNMQNLSPKRLWRLTKQVGFKLQSLLQMRLRLNEDVRQILWGDDSEADATIYSLYSDICARRLDQKTLSHVLRHFFVSPSQIETIMDLQNKIPKHDPVEKIYINLAVDTDAEYYIKFGRRVMPSFNTFQTILDLYQDHRVSLDQIVSVAQDLILNYDFTVDELEKSLDDLVRRNVLAEPTLNDVIPLLKARSLIRNSFELSTTAKPVTSQINGRVYELEGHFEPWVPEHIDYIHDYR